MKAPSKKERNQKMKKFFLLVAATMAMTTSFAETEEQNALQKVENFDMSFDMRRLAVTLGLTTEQMEMVSVIQRNFNDKMQTAAKAEFKERASLVDKAVTKDIRDMYYILSDKQFDTYMKLLNATLRNRGLK